MAVHFTNDKKFIGIWFVYPPDKDSGFPHRRADYFAVGWLNPDGTLEFTYRWHYYDNPSDPSEGERSWKGFRGQEPADGPEIERFKTIMGGIAEMNVLRNGSKMEFLDCGLCNGPGALKLLEGRDWWHKAKERVFDQGG